MSTEFPAVAESGKQNTKEALRAAIHSESPGIKSSWVALNSGLLRKSSHCPGLNIVMIIIYGQLWRRAESWPCDCSGISSSWYQEAKNSFTLKWLKWSVIWFLLV